jgi:hypothetical protein
MKPEFVITAHAQQRFAERVNIGITPTVTTVKRILLEGVKAATRLKEKTHTGELLYINPGPTYSLHC